MIILKLFWSFFIVGLFSFGGGYAAMPFIQEQVVDLNGWLTFNEFVDVVTISQMTPGPIGINAATFVGMKVSGIPGAVMATVGFVTPSCIIVLTLAYLYYKYRELSTVKGILKGLRPAVVAMIAIAGISILQMALLGSKADSWLSIDLTSFDFLAAIIFAAALFILRKFKCSPIYVMLGSGFVGLIIYYFAR
jgi:chromate transporter